MKVAIRQIREAHFYGAPLSNTLQVGDFNEDKHGKLLQLSQNLKIYQNSSNLLS